MDYSPPGFSVCGIFQARILEWFAIFSSRNIPDPRIEPVSLSSPILAGRFFTTESPGKQTIYKAIIMKAVKQTHRPVKEN